MNNKLKKMFVFFSKFDADLTIHVDEVAKIFGLVDHHLSNIYSFHIVIQSR